MIRYITGCHDASRPTGRPSHAAKPVRWNENIRMNKSRMKWDYSIIRKSIASGQERMISLNPIDIDTRDVRRYPNLVIINVLRKTSLSLMELEKTLIVNFTNANLQFQNIGKTIDPDAVKFVFYVATNVKFHKKIDNISAVLANDILVEKDIDPNWTYLTNLLNNGTE